MTTFHLLHLAAIVKKSKKEFKVKIYKIYPSFMFLITLIFHHLQNCSDLKHRNYLTQSFSSTLEIIIPQMFSITLANLFP